MHFRAFFLWFRARVGLQIEDQQVDIKLDADAI